MDRDQLEVHHRKGGGLRCRREEGTHMEEDRAVLLRHPLRVYPDDCDLLPDARHQDETAAHVSVPHGKQVVSGESGLRKKSSTRLDRMRVRDLSPVTLHLPGCLDPEAVSAISVSILGNNKLPELEISGES